MGGLGKQEHNIPNNPTTSPSERGITKPPKIIKRNTTNRQNQHQSLKQHQTNNLFTTATATHNKAIQPLFDSKYAIKKDHQYTRRR